MKTTNKTTKKSMFTAPKAVVNTEITNNDRMKITLKQVGSGRNGESIASSIFFETVNNENFAAQALYELYSIVDTYKKCNSYLFNFAEPILLVIERNGQTIDLEKLNSSAYVGITNKLKLQWTKQGRLRFSERVRVAIKAVSNDHTTICNDESAIDFE